MQGPRRLNATYPEDRSTLVTSFLNALARARDGLDEPRRPRLRAPRHREPKPKVHRQADEPGKAASRLPRLASRRARRRAFADAQAVRDHLAEWPAAALLDLSAPRSGRTRPPRRRTADRERTDSSRSARIPCSWRPPSRCLARQSERSSCRLIRRVSRGSACEATSAEEAQPASSTSPMSAWRSRSAARLQQTLSGSSVPRRRSAPYVAVKLIETEERRRVTRAGFRTQKECAAAMNKVLTAVEERSYVAPSKMTVRESCCGSGYRPSARRSADDLLLLRPARRVPHLPHISSLQSVDLTQARINALYATLRETGRRMARRVSPRSVHHVHAVLHRACKDAVRWGRLTRNPVDAADPREVVASVAR